MGSINKKKVSFLIPRITHGGSERIFIQISNYLANNSNYEIEFFLNGSEESQNHLLDKKIRIFSKTNISYRKYLYYLIKYYNSSKPNIVFTSLYIIGFVALIARFFSKHKPKIVFGAHNALSYKINFPDNKSDKFVLNFLAKYLLNKADKVISVSKGVGDELIQEFGLDSSKLIIIYGPTLNKKIIDKYITHECNHRFFKLKKYKIITCLGRLSPQKGYDIILKSFAKFIKKFKAKLIIIGEGSEKIKLEKICLKLCLNQHVSFIGSQKNPYKFIAKSDIFLTASRWEGLSIAIIDALSTGTNVVATNCKYGPSEILDNGKFGILTKVNCEKDLLRGMIRSITKKNSHSSKLKNKSRAKYFFNLNPEKVYLELIDELLK